MGRLADWVQRRPTTILVKLLSPFVVIGVALLILVALIIITLDGVGNHISQINTYTGDVAAAQRLLQDTHYLSVFYTELNTDLSNITTTEQLTFFNRSLEDCNEQVQGLITDINSDVQSLNSTDMASMQAILKTVNGPITNVAKTTDDILLKTQNNQLQQALTELATLKNGDLITSNFDEAIQAVNSSTGNMNQVIQNARIANQSSINDANTTRSNTEIILIVVSVIIIFIAIGFGILLTSAFSIPLERLRLRLLALAEGDLSTPLDVINGDEFGEVATTFNQSIARLGKIIELMQTQSIKVSSAAAQIAATSRQSANFSAEQAGSMSEAAITIEELNNTAQQIADAASLVSEAAEEALGSAAAGQETLRETIVGINSLKQRVQEIAVKILALTERSQRVGHVIEQINSIAEEIHLLALNAAIESAAAGENGKRFAVVAGRVKQLADKSRNATKEVQTVLTEIQMATNASVMATEQGMKEAERGVELVHKGGNANESIIQAVERTVQLASAISLATQQQRSASEQVVGTMQQLTGIIQNGASSSKQSFALAVDLDGIANQLKEVSSQFKVEYNYSSNNSNGSGGTTDGDENLTPLLPLADRPFDYSTTNASDNNGGNLLSEPY